MADRTPDDRLYGDSAELAVLADVAGAKDWAQAFFANLANSARQPGYGERERIFVAELLKRAVEAKLYTPEAL